MVQKEIRQKRRSDQEWLDIIHECRNSGMSDKAWCEAHEIHPSKFYYHIRRLKASACEIPVAGTAAVSPKQEIVQVYPDEEPVEDSFFAQNPATGRLASDAAVRLSVGGCRVEIFNSAASETICHTLAALRQLCQAICPA